jgi:hypothetical protein
MLTPDYGHQMQGMSKGEFRLEVETVPQKYGLGASNCIAGAAKLPQNPRLRASDCAYEGPCDSPKHLLFRPCFRISCGFTTTFFIGGNE